MAYHRIYKYTSIGRPLEPDFPTNKAVLLLMPIAALLGAFAAWKDGLSGVQLAQQALTFVLILFGAWALARELDPDDHAAPFIGMAVALWAAWMTNSPGILVVFATLGLVRIVNRTTGIVARKSDSLILVLLSISVIYFTESPFYGFVAALAFFLDGTLKEPLRHQWVFGLVCLGGSVVYMVDHDLGVAYFKKPDALFDWVALLFLLIFALNILLQNTVHTKGDVSGRLLDINRVRGGMTVGLFAALQGMAHAENVVIIISAIAGICIGMAFRKGFKAPASG